MGQVLRDLPKPNFWDLTNQSTDLYDLLERKGKEKRDSHLSLIIESLRYLGDLGPTQKELQRYTRLRRKRFIELMKYLIFTGDVTRIGRGTKGQPFRYYLGKI